MFDEATKLKIPWDDRVRLIGKVFPSTENLDWYKVFKQDPALLGTIINDIIKASQASPRRPGKRASVDAPTTMRELTTLAGDDYSLEEFPKAFAALMGGRSIRHTAARTGLDRNTVYRLLHGKMPPNAYLMEAIAKAFGKDPSFFAEYREAWIVSCIAFQLQRIPESSITFYRKMRSIGKWGEK